MMKKTCIKCSLAQTKFRPFSCKKYASNPYYI
nr:MAG TPA: hypothetical protein [Caudoviricetes sp.]